MGANRLDSASQRELDTMPNRDDSPPFPMIFIPPIFLERVPPTTRPRVYERKAQASSIPTHTEKVYNLYTLFAHVHPNPYHCTHKITSTLRMA